MSVSSAFWRTLRQDFETLQPHKFSLWWNSVAQRGLIGRTPGKSHWAWMEFPDESLKARLSALALRGARALCFDSEDDWYDQLRIAEFVGFEPIGSSRQKSSESEFQDSDFGPIKDVVKESITLCYKLEAELVSIRGQKDGKPSRNKRKRVGPIADKKTAAARVREPSSPPKKRGRPQIIPDKTKNAAIKLKAAGGTNRDLAKLIYNSRYPSAQQVKNVPAILRHHKLKLEKSISLAKRRRSSPQPHKTRG